jgi:hypothetical protein
MLVSQPPMLVRRDLLLRCGSTSLPLLFVAHMCNDCTASALAMVVGWEALIVLHDLRGLAPDEQADVCTWAANALIQAALRDSAPPALRDSAPPALRDSAPPARAR